VIAQVWANALGWSSFLILSAEQIARMLPTARKATAIAIIACRSRTFEAREGADAGKCDR
jgi:hypothetical protein